MFIPPQLFYFSQNNTTHTLPCKTIRVKQLFFCFSFCKSELNQQVATNEREIANRELDGELVNNVKRENSARWIHHVEGDYVSAVIGGVGTANAQEERLIANFVF